MTMTFRPVVAGTTDVSAIIRIVDSTDGTPETGVVYNTAGIDIRYRRDGATDTAITEATLAALDTAHTDGGFLHIGNGYYRIDLPDAACASGVNGVLVHGTVTGMVVIGTYIPLLAVNPYDTVRMGLTALPNVASGSAGAIPTVGTGTAQINVSGGRADANATYFGGAAGTFASGRPEVNTTNIAGTTLPANGPIPFFGIVDMGTAQSYDGATDKLRLRAAFSSPDIVGCWIWIYSSTNGLHTRGIVTAWDNTLKDATIDTPVEDPTGTLLYVLVASPKSSSALPLPANMTQIGGDTQSATDLKDFADAGYDPATNKVQGVVTTDTATAVTTVNGLAANTITATSIAADAITAAKIADGAIDAATFAAGAITASAIAADAIGASELAADAVTEIVNGVLTTAMTEAYPTDGSTATVAQMLYLIAQSIGEFSVSGTTITVKKLDGTTTAATYTLDSSTAPTSRTRAT